MAVKINSHEDTQSHEPAIPPVSQPAPQGREEKLEALVQEAVQLIDTADPEKRAELREYALSLLRGATETQPAEAAQAIAKRRGPFNPLVLAIPVVLLGLLVFFLFPAMGLFLFGVAVLLAGWGILRPLLGRRH